MKLNCIERTNDVVNKYNKNPGFIIRMSKSFNINTTLTPRIFQANIERIESIQRKLI